MSTINYSHLYFSCSKTQQLHQLFLIIKNKTIYVIAKCDCIPSYYNQKEKYMELPLSSFFQFPTSSDSNDDLTSIHEQLFTQYEQILENKDELINALAIKNFPGCAYHPNKQPNNNKCKYYCLDCDNFICSECYTNNHFTQCKKNTIFKTFSSENSIFPINETLTYSLIIKNYLTHNKTLSEIISIINEIKEHYITSSNTLKQLLFDKGTEYAGQREYKLIDTLKQDIENKCIESIQRQRMIELFFKFQITIWKYCEINNKDFTYPNNILNLFQIDDYYKTEIQKPSTLSIKSIQAYKKLIEKYIQRTNFIKIPIYNSKRNKHAQINEQEEIELKQLQSELNSPIEMLEEYRNTTELSKALLNTTNFNKIQRQRLKTALLEKEEQTNNTGDISQSVLISLPDNVRQQTSNNNINNNNTDIPIDQNKQNDINNNIKETTPSIKYEQCPYMKLTKLTSTKGFRYDKNQTQPLCVLILQNGNIAVCGARPIIKIFNNKDLTCIMKYKGHKAKVNYLCKFGESNFLSCSDDFTVKRWAISKATLKQNLELSVSRGGLLKNNTSSHTGKVFHILQISKISAISCSEDRTLRKWNVNYVNQSVELLTMKTVPKVLARAKSKKSTKLIIVTIERELFTFDLVTKKLDEKSIQLNAYTFVVPSSINVIGDTKVLIGSSRGISLVDFERKEMLYELIVDTPFHAFFVLNENTFLCTSSNKMKLCRLTEKSIEVSKEFNTILKRISFMEGNLNNKLLITISDEPVLKQWTINAVNDNSIYNN